MGDVTTRRELLRAGATGAAAIGASTLLRSSLISRALAAAPSGCAGLDSIEHVVILIQENRSFDSYFGTLGGVDGFGSRRVEQLDDGSGLTIFAQPGYPGGYRGDHLYPFRLNSYSGGECTNDIDHSWAPQHAYWNQGRLDGFVREHIKVDGPVNGPLTMGYYERGDLSFYYALADAFTICDHYHCSVIGPTDPNRLYSVSATVDPAGRHGGPILSTSTSRVERFGSLSWTTMPEQLQARGISWKVYGSPDGNFGDNVLPYFKQYQTNPALAAGAFAPSFPGTFQADVAAATLPQVSWVLAPLVASEHSPGPTEWGELVAAQVLDTLVSNPAVWSKTALFITYDENGGFFDHVPPPVPDRGTPGEFLTVNPLPADAGGVAGPIGLGFRVPMLVVSPFSRGGFVCSEVFDHTSTLRFLEARFGAEVPNLTAWRRSVTGDLTSAFNFIAPDSSVPSLPQPAVADSRVLSSDCAVGGSYDLLNPPSTTLTALEEKVVAPYPVTVNTAPPRQEQGQARRPSGLVCGRTGHHAELHAKGVRAATSGQFKGTIATFTYSDTHARASEFTAAIHWGDGHVSRGRVSGSHGRFRVHGEHRYRRDRRYRVKVRVVAGGGQLAAAHSEVTVATPAFTG
ncbi:MAG TPA: alkaline phosphatase family protein [Solirubrobacteraceae bacterium]|nr:alkaline phosphatase family protein [Solirubrobacteraceae bacterium]